VAIRRRCGRQPDACQHRDARAANVCGGPDLCGVERVEHANERHEHHLRLQPEDRDGGHHQVDYHDPPEYSGQQRSGHRANYGIGAGSIALSGCPGACLLTYTVAVAAGIPIYIEVSGMTNTPTSGTYSSSITTRTAVPATIDGATASNNVTFNAGGVATTINVAKSAVFSMDVNAFTLALDPAVATRRHRP